VAHDWRFVALVEAIRRALRVGLAVVASAVVASFWVADRILPRLARARAGFKRVSAGRRKRHVRRNHGPIESPNTM
jgi:hypothetical protein